MDSIFVDAALLCFPRSFYMQDCCAKFLSTLPPSHSEVPMYIFLARGKVRHHSSLSWAGLGSLIQFC
jgi:hypothetical protein